MATTPSATNTVEARKSAPETLASLLKQDSHAADPRNFDHGGLIPDEGYCNQPYIVITKNGNWV